MKDTYLVSGEAQSPYWPSASRADGIKHHAELLSKAKQQFTVAGGNPFVS